MHVNLLTHFQKWVQSYMYQYCLTLPLNINKTPLDLAIDFSRVERLLGAPISDIPLVTPGKVVKIFDAQTNEKATLTLVAPNKSDPESAQISYFSLLGSRLLGCRIGDTVEIKIFGRKEIFHVIDIKPM